MKALWVLGAMAALIGLSIALHTRFVSGAWSEHKRVATDLAAVQHTNTALATETQQLQRQIDALRTRPEVQERVVRHELGVVRPGEGIVHVGKN